MVAEPGLLLFTFASAADVHALHIKKAAVSALTCWIHMLI